MRAPLFIATIVAAMVDTSGVLASESLCTSRDHMLAALAKKYKETPVAVGLENRGALLEVLTSEDGATWTVIVTGPQGESCLVAAGEGWQDLVRELKGPQL